MDRRRLHKTGIGMIIMVLMTALVTVATAGCGNEADAGGGSLNLSAADDGKTFTVNVGDIIRVVLEANATTGYSWATALSTGDDALLEQVGEPEYVTDSTEEMLVGSGGTAILTFKAVAKGEVDLVLTYAQQFDENGEPAETFEAHIVIE